MTVPDSLAFLKELLPPDQALQNLTVPMSGNATPEAIRAIEQADLTSILRCLAWLYVDELERAHDICQALPDVEGAALHAIVHRREGDFWNAQYWWHRAGLAEGEGAKLTKAVEAGDRSEFSITRQRDEWAQWATRFSA